MLDGAKFEYNMSIVEINDDGPVFRKVYRDEEGKVTGYSEETEQVYADSTIISISQGPKSKLVNTTEGLKATQSGLLETDENGEDNGGGNLRLRRCGAGSQDGGSGGGLLQEGGRSHGCLYEE